MRPRIAGKTMKAMAGCVLLQKKRDDDGNDTDEAQNARCRMTEDQQAGKNIENCKG